MRAGHRDDARRRRSARAGASEHGTLPPGMAFFRMGAGRPLLVLPGLTSDHELPEGSDLRFQARQFEPLARSREVWWVNRRRGLPAGVSMAGIAADYAEVISSRFDPPVDVFGTSTGGSVALALAVDHPSLVRRLVVHGAYRLSARGRQTQRVMARELRAGNPRRAAAAEFGAVAAGPVSGAAMTALGWLLGRRFYGSAGSDVLAVIDAEDAFDVGDRLGAITAPTLVVGGARDRFYSPALFRETAAWIPDARLLLSARRGHAVLRGRVHDEILAFLGS